MGRFCNKKADNFCVDYCVNCQVISDSLQESLCQCGTSVVVRIKKLIEKKVSSFCSGMLQLRLEARKMESKIITWRRRRHFSDCYINSLVEVSESLSRLINKIVEEIDEAFHFAILLENYEPENGIIFNSNQEKNPLYQAQVASPSAILDDLVVFHQRVVQDFYARWVLPNISDSTISSVYTNSKYESEVHSVKVSLVVQTLSVILSELCSAADGSFCHVWDVIRSTSLASKMELSVEQLFDTVLQMTRIFRGKLDGILVNLHVAVEAVDGLSGLEHNRSKWATSCHMLLEQTMCATSSQLICGLPIINKDPSQYPSQYPSHLARYSLGLPERF